MTQNLRTEADLSPSPSPNRGGERLVQVELAQSEGLLQQPTNGTLEATFIQAGPVAGWEVWLPAEVLREAAALFSGKGSFLDHPDLFESHHLSALMGVTSEALFNPFSGTVDGRIRLMDTPAAELFRRVIDQVLEDRERGLEVPDVGLSAVLWWAVNWDERVNGLPPVTRIRDVVSVDAVFRPAAGGTVHRVLASALGRATFSLPQPMGRKEDKVTDTRIPAPAVPDQASAVVRELDELQRLAARAALDQALANSGLPVALQEDIRSRLGDRSPRAAEIATEIERARATLGRLVEERVITGLGAVREDHRPSLRGMLTSFDQVQLAFERLMGLPLASEHLSIPRLSGIRELYHLVTGDRDFHGIFRSDQAMLANATTTTMAELVRNVMNKMLVEQWTILGRAGYSWWQKIVHEEDFSSLQQVSWVMLGGFGDLPNVAEGASYTELVWDDKRETADWTKKGGFIGLTLEMMDRDDTARVRSIPRLLAKAAIRTLSNSVATIFTSNPTLSDSVALFHASHGNTATNALSSANWDVALQAMFKQTELNSGKRLGVRPRYLVVPIELEKTALQILGAQWDPALTTAELDNVRRQSLGDVVVAPELTSATGWYAVADPAIAPGLGVGYRYGRTPEVFVAQDEVVGSMFSNDELRVKVRFLYAAGVIDYRPLYRGNT